MPPAFTLRSVWGLVEGLGFRVKGCLKELGCGVQGLGSRAREDVDM